MSKMGSIKSTITQNKPHSDRIVAADVRSRVIADCAALLPLARSACAAMDEVDETEVLRLFCGESQKQTLRRL